MVKRHIVVANKRSYSEPFLKCGSVRIVSECTEKSQCVLCVQVLSTESMKQYLLKRYYNQNIMTVKTSLSFFERTASRVKRSRMATCGVFQQRNRVYVEAFFHVSLRIANAEMTHTNDEKLILPCENDIID